METISLNNVNFSYPGGNKALENINFQVSAGERVAVLGANGAGKSTLFQLFNGLLTPSSGEVKINGLPVEKKNYKTIRRMVGMVFQDPDDQLFSPTVKQELSYGLVNLGAPAGSIEKSVKWALQVVGLEGYEDKNPCYLSGGEKKRVALASVLVMRPEVLVLDEPTAALDPRGVAQLIALLNEINHNLHITLVFSSHDVDMVPLLADRIYVMNQGKIALSGMTREVFSEVDLIRENNLRLPRVAHLTEILRKDGMKGSLPLPLTIGQARETMRQIRETD
ncbi:abc transporter [Lucifera butyrica]|uniref:ABC transporter ATP-binding protein n=1 Tax=Lucifera butyrica TaxID=1351585 RepID=A0A498RI52_9FIRM|nr:ATP-binding cassette domain-containing protein [Lucifera butyrica]VBB09772.1 abc transporter [Lucifera butyrica]